MKIHKDVRFFPPYSTIFLEDAHCMTELPTIEIRLPNFEVHLRAMTSPTINGGNGQKDTSKNDSSSTVSEDAQPRQEPQERPTPPLTAWWRVFKLANLLMQQGC